VKSQRDKLIADRINDVSLSLEDLSRFPQSEACRERAQNAIKMLRKTFRDDSYPEIFLLLAMGYIANNIEGGMAYRNATMSGRKVAWTMLADVLGD
jgi:hypothetical protein